MSALSSPVLSWLKARAKGLKGSFEPDMIEAASGPLGGGWSVVPTTGLLPATGSNSGMLEQFQRRAGVARPEAMQDFRRAEWFAIAADAPTHLPIVTVPDADVDAKGRVIVEHPIPGTLYAREAGPGLWGQMPIQWVRSPAMGVPAWLVRAPSGKVFMVLDKPRPRTEPLTADAFWKWAYAEGMAEAAQAALPSKAQEAATARAEAVKKGMGTCGVCFETHALHTRSHTLVQHGYKMRKTPWSHGHAGMIKDTGDCFGVQYLPFETSPNATAHYAQHLAKLAHAYADKADQWEAGQHSQIRLLHTKPAWGGRETVEEVPPHVAPVSSARQSQHVEVIGPDHPTWAARVARKVADLRDQSATYTESSRWYANAAAAWPAYPEGL